MIIVGAVLAVWGAVVLYLAPHLHAGWCVRMRRAGLVVLVAGLAISAVGAVWILVEAM